MRQIIVLPILLFSSFVSLAQVKFKNGYYIDKQGNKTECFIKDVESKYSPTSFTYRRTEDGFNETMSTDAISEFSVGGNRYLNVHTKYDRSPQDIRKLGVISNPDWLEADIVVREIVSGKASLYHYSTGEYSLFFFSVDGSPIEQLVYKQYYAPGDLTMLVPNNLYLSQLNQKVKCPSQPTITDKQVQYREAPLAKQFTAFNVCNGEVAVKKEKKKVLSFRITPGFDSWSAKAVVVQPNLDFGTHNSFRIGGEFQITLPFNRNKWAVIVEPSYSSYSGKTPKNVRLEIQSFYIPIGIRHRFFLSEQSSIFLNAAVFPEIPLKHDHFTSNRDNAVVSESMAVGFVGGVGYSFWRLSLEARYSPKWQRNQDVYGYDYTRSSVILGFRVF